MKLINLFSLLFGLLLFSACSDNLDLTEEFHLTRQILNNRSCSVSDENLTLESCGSYYTFGCMDRCYELAGEQNITQEPMFVLELNYNRTEYCSSNNFLVITDYSNNKSALNDTFVKDLISRGIIKQEWCEVQE